MRNRFPRGPIGAGKTEARRLSGSICAISAIRASLNSGYRCAKVAGVIASSAAKPIIAKRPGAMDRILMT
jgi:hypothetical protein